MAGKLANFQSFVYASHLNVICVTETWLSDSIFDKEIVPSHYTIYRKDRGSRGGGVLVAVDDSIPSSLNFSPPDLEVVSVQLGVTHPTTLCTVYVPPNSSTSFNTLIPFLTDILPALLLEISIFLIFVGPHYQELPSYPLFSVPLCLIVTSLNTFMTQLIIRETLWI